MDKNEIQTTKNTTSEASEATKTLEKPPLEQIYQRLEEIIN